MAGPRRPAPHLDPNVPCDARMYDYLLGGKDNFAVDRRAIEKILAIGPYQAVLCRENREFLGRVVRYLAAEAGIRQFIDFGSGLPTQENVHQIAHATAPDARVVYVDYDPMAVIHGRALLTHADNVAYIEGDVRKPDAVLADPHVRKLINLDEPVAVLLFAILYAMPADENSRILAELRQAMAPGSYLAMSHPSGSADSPDIKAIAEALDAAGGIPYITRTHDEILAFFTGFELVDPGVVRPREWRPDNPKVTDLQAEPGVPDMWGGVGHLR
jgi:hypothetical protein